MYLLTEAQHTQIVDALELPSLKTVSMLIERDAALAMLKAMQPVSPAAWVIEFENGDTELHFHDANNSLGESQIPLYTPEQSK
jgi:hypothetical protein